MDRDIALLQGGQAAAIEDHGGSLARARARFPRAPEPWIDLSTGINPYSYPLFELPATALTRLPEPAATDDLQGIAARAYGAPSAASVVAAPGTQILLPRIFSLARQGRAVVLGPTYGEHRRVAGLFGHQVFETSDPDRLREGDIAVIVNPNNPDGGVVSRSFLLDLAHELDRKGGLLVVDEAFMDVGPAGESLAGDVGLGNIVVLRSFGKFFGLAGVRLGFAIGPEHLAGRMRAELGPWAVSGPALAYGARALADSGWQLKTRGRLAREAERLDLLLAGHGLSVGGGTHLFRLVRERRSAGLFELLGHRGILVRNFSERPGELRFGLPGGEGEWRRLQAALAVWKEAHGAGAPTEAEP